MAGARSLASTVFDLGRSALAERLRPSCPDVPAPKKGKTMSFDLNGWAGALRHALRTLRRSPGFAATVVGTLGLAIGTITAVFAVLDRVLLSPLPYAHPERLVSIAGTAPGSDMTGEFGPAAEFLLQYQDGGKLVEDVAIYSTFTNSLRVGERVERIRMGAASRSLYSTLGARPALGRLPLPEDEDRAVVISDALLRSWFGSDPSVVGRSYEIAGESRTIVGVMRPEFRFPNSGPLLWLVEDVRAEGLDAGALRLQHGRAPRCGRRRSRPRRRS